jgi:hypothetical protein
MAGTGWAGTIMRWHHLLRTGASGGQQQRGKNKTPDHHRGEILSR